MQEDGEAGSRQGEADSQQGEIKADAERAAKLATALAEKERVANRTEEEVKKAACALQAAQQKKDRDRKLADEVDNLVEGRRAGSGRVRMPSALSPTADYGQWNERSGD
jgi:plasmid stabilization system protein ParE